MGMMNIRQEIKRSAKKQIGNHHRSLSNSFKFAGRGITRVFLCERSFRLQLLCFTLTIIAGFVFRITGTEWIFVVLSGSLVLVTEMINTALEYVVDLVTEEYRVLAEHIKNISAGAVLVSSLLAVVVGLIIFIPYLLQYF
jgi:undecaprenol kinase